MSSPAGTVPDAATTGAPVRATPLAGCTVGVTAERRREELGTALERRGARVVYGQAISVVPLADDQDLMAATEACLEGRLDVVVGTTGVGFRGWLEAAEGWGHADALLARMAEARVLARGPKVRGAMRNAGITEEWAPPSESSSEVLEYLLAGGVDGLRIALQLHGDPLTDLVQALRDAGAEILTVPV